MAPTEAGRHPNTRIRATVSEFTDRLWGDLRAEERAAAGCVLSTVLARANAELGSAQLEDPVGSSATANLVGEPVPCVAAVCSFWSPIPDPEDDRLSDWACGCAAGVRNSPASRRPAVAATLGMLDR